MSDLVTTLVDAGLALARLGGGVDAGRRDAWIERLRVNLPELETLASLARFPSEPADGYLAPPGAPAARPATPGQTGPRPPESPQGESPSDARALLTAAIAARARAIELEALHAFTSLASTAELEAQARRVSDRGIAPTALPLAGVPIAVKDLMAVQGFVQTNGSGAMPRVSAERDAEAVRRLRNAGAIVVGVTNLHEYAYGITSDNPHFGAVVNPRAPERLPGGSSGGSAAAVAAGIVPIAVGTDTAGSIRIPAACCGVVGFKPTFDAIPRDGVQPLSASLDHVGPIAASVADAAHAFAVMSGEPFRALAPTRLAGLRIGIPRRHFFEPLADEVALGVARALARMTRDGAELVDVDIDGIETAAAIQFATLCSEATDALRHLLATPANLGADVRVRIEIGQCIPATWYVHAQRARAALAAAFDRALDSVDLLVTPTLRVTPPPRGAREATAGDRVLPLHTAMTALTMPFNLCGMPALTIPAASVEGELPVGIQLAGRRGDDWRVLEIGARVADLLAR
ncbi:MAG TPA: amidase [Casimicrobiaceae bacterium]